MKTSKTIFAALFCLLLTAPIFSQQVDLASVKELDRQLTDFSLVLGNRIQQLEGINRMPALRASGKLLRYRTIDMLRNVEAVYPVDESYWMNAAFDNAIAQDIQAFAPATSNFLRTRATITIIEGLEKEEAARPEYYRVLRKIKKISGRLGNATSFRQINLYSEMLKMEHLKLKELIQ
jgi:hypothetical protein